MRRLTLLAFFMLFVAFVISFKFKHFYHVKHYYKPQVTTKSNRLPQADLQICRKWAEKFNKVYTTLAEEERACLKLLKNKRKIDAHNKKFSAGQVKFTRSLWQYSDLSDEEKREILLGLELPEDAVPDEIDVRQVKEYFVKI